MGYETLQSEVSQQCIYIYERPLNKRTKGLQADNVIWINQSISTTTEKACILAEELGHYYTSSGDITDQKDIRNRKQELRARQWAYGKLIPLTVFIEAYHARIKGRFELAEFLDVTEEFLQAAVDRYREKHGLHVVIDDKYTITFEPLGVIETL
jgi:hypothetical protein